MTTNSSFTFTRTRQDSRRLLLHLFESHHLFFFFTVQYPAAAMDSLLLHSHTTVWFRASRAPIKQALRLRDPTFSVKEITLGPLVFGSKKCIPPPFLACSVNRDPSKGESSPRKSSASGRTAKEAKINQFESSEGKASSADQEEIISLFRRIQSSISEGESKDSKRRTSDSRGDKPAAESVLEIIRSSRKQTRDNPSPKGRSKQISRRTQPKREGGVVIKDSQPIEDFILSRPPSNFVKRSPIPFPSAPRGKDPLLISKASADAAETIVSELPELEGMKLSELKELAKSKGVKGYSKLKKKELVELLRS